MAVFNPFQFFLCIFHWYKCVTITKWSMLLSEKVTDSGRKKMASLWWTVSKSLNKTKISFLNQSEIRKESQLGSGESESFKKLLKPQKLCKGLSVGCFIFHSRIMCPFILDVRYRFYIPFICHIEWNIKYPLEVHYTFLKHSLKIQITKQECACVRLLSRLEVSHLEPLEVLAKML